MFRSALWLAAMVGLAACDAPPQSQPDPRFLGPPVSAGPTPGLTEREPDTCRAGQLATALVGQGAATVRTVPLTGPLRLISPGQVVDQEEYRSDRINVHLDGKGTITRLSCG